MHEFGIGAGGFNYTGDINPRYNFLNYRPAGNVFYRFNASHAIALRLAFTFGQLHGTERYSKEPIANLRKASFNSTITEVALMTEYNFINYRDKKQLLKFSPYFTGGLAIFGTTPDVTTNSEPEDWDDQSVLVAIPFGVGIKFILSKQWNLGTEFIARKTFTDYIDGISKGTIGNQTTGNTHDKDWYFYTGLTLSYTIFKVDCPGIY